MTIKKVLCLSAIALLASCAKIEYPAPYMSVSVIDYLSITNETGIMLSESNSINKDYDAIASIIVDEFVGYEYKEISYIEGQNRKITNADGTVNYEHPRKVTKKGYFPTKANFADGITAAAIKAKELGANAIINISIKPALRDGQPGYTVTGMAIRIK